LKSFLDLSSHDALYAEHFRAGAYGSDLSEPNSSFCGIDYQSDYESDLGSFPEGAVEIFSSGKRFYADHQFPVLFEPSEVSTLLRSLERLGWKEQRMIDGIRDFIRKVTESGDCLGVSRIDT
jgi:hypothetical protein